MAVQWGSWLYSGGYAYCRLGIDVSGTTLIVYFESGSTASHAWNATLNRGGPWSGSSSVSMNGSGSFVREIYRQNVGNSNGTYTASLSMWAGTVSVSRSVVFTQPPTGKPGKPTFKRTSGNALVLSWNPIAGATSYDIDYKHKWKPGAGSSLLGTSATTSKASSGFALDSSVTFWVRAANAGGKGPWSEASDPFYTTPPQLPAPVLSVSGTTVTGTVAGTSYYQSGLEVERSTGGGFLVGTGTGGLANSFTDTSPGVGVKYRVRRFVGADDPDARVFGAWSPWSTPVTTISPPLAPTILAPLGSVSNAAPVVFKFRHEPVDGTALSSAEVQYRKAGSTGAWTTLIAAPTNLTEDATGLSWVLTQAQSTALIAAGPEVEYRIRSKGQHPDYGPYSPVQVVRLVSPPVVTITSPTMGTFTAGTVTTKWGFGQAEGLPQSAWKAVLYVDGVLAETLSGNNAATQAAFKTRLENNSSVRVEVAVAASGIWSDMGDVTVQVVFTPPAAPTVTGGWDETAGTINLTVTPGSGSPATVRFDILRSVDAGATWEAWQDDLPADSGGISLTDPEALSNGETWYQIIAYSALDAETATILVVNADSGAFWLGAGDGFQNTARLPWDRGNPPQFSVDGKRARSSEYYGGRALPVAYAGSQVSRHMSLTGVLVDGETENPTRRALEEVFLDPAPVHLLRSPEGDRYYVQLDGTPLTRDTPGLWAFQLGAVQVERPEREAAS